jgi:hypothetical protein
MNTTRRAFLGLLGGALLGAAGRASSGQVSPLPALRRGAAFLEQAQDADGAWRSTHYGFFRDGDALTPLILLALHGVPRSSRDDDAVAPGCRWLDALTDRLSGREVLPLRYPLFTASYAARFYGARGDRQRAGAWAALIESLQLTRALGWPADDPRQGGWSDAPLPPVRAPGRPCRIC